MQSVLTMIRPDGIRSIGGFIGERFQANRNARLKDQTLSEEFIRLHERQNHDGWFWIGEQVGKWLDASAYTGLIARDDVLIDRVHELLLRLERAQENDGYVGVTSRRQRHPVRGMQLYEWYYVLHGLLVCSDLLDSQVALEIARRLGEYIIRTWGPDPGQFPLAGRFPGNGHGGGEGTLILEPIVLLGQRTGDDRFVEWGQRTLSMWDTWLTDHPESRFTCDLTAMQQFASGDKDVWELRENIHAHTFHMTLLGIAALHNATGESIYREIVLASVDRLRAEWIMLTGGMSSSERYLQRRYYHPRSDIEVCPQHTWILLLDQALRWTGQADYAAEIERTLFNQFLAAQVADGSNWSYMTPLTGHAQEPEGPNCCNAAGHRIAGRMPVYFYGSMHGAPVVLQYSPSEAQLVLKGGQKLTLQQETDFPSNGQIKISVRPEEPLQFRLYLRIPPYAQGASVQVAGEAPMPAPEGQFLAIDRRWQPGDMVKLDLPFRWTVYANDRVAALVSGPLVYAYFQEAQDNPVTSHGQRGIFPEDVALRLDPAQRQLELQVEPAPERLLGPAVRVRGEIRPQAPMFADGAANTRLCGRRTGSFILLPFVNQGALLGEYSVFFNTMPPS